MSDSKNELALTRVCSYYQLAWLWPALATAEGKAKEGQSNQGTRGSHSSGGKKPEKHDKAEARRAKEQKAADAAKEAAKKKDNSNG